MRLFATIVLVFILDQATKIYVRTNFHLYESVQVIDNWFKLTLTENPGIAFGLQIGPRILLTSIAIFATALIIVYLIRLKTAPMGYRMSLAFIIAGAIGNVFDRIFYGKIFGYDNWFYGNVVDFIHFDIWRGRVDESIPLLGGKYLALLPIWNIADMSIVLGVILIIYYQRQLEVEVNARIDKEEKIQENNEVSNHVNENDSSETITESPEIASNEMNDDLNDTAPPAEENHSVDKIIESQENRPSAE